METPYLNSLLSCLPSELATQIKPLPPAVVENLLRFTLGAECHSGLSEETNKQWTAAQRAFLQPTKRPLAESSPPPAKRQKTDTALYTLTAISITSPLRKKLSISISPTSIELTHPTTNTIEATIPVTAITRAFILPTRGKPKPHWTVVLLPSDEPTKSHPQLIFGLDAHTTTSGALPKGTETLSAIRQLLSHLPNTTTISEPSLSCFQSAKKPPSAGIDAYRGAKMGTLWFFDEGILWGESKTCEYWAVGDLVNKTEGVRMVSATGRTCSVILTRKTGGEGGGGDDAEDLGTETEFGMVDGKEQEGIAAWVRARKHLFGKEKSIGVLEEEGSDEEDEDFAFDEDDDDGGSCSSSSSEEDDGEGEEAAESSNDEEDDAPLKPEHHPLLRPGAMPKRMTKAAMDMVIGMVEGDLISGGPTANDDDEDEGILGPGEVNGEEKDELEMDED